MASVAQLLISPDAGLLLLGIVLVYLGAELLVSGAAALAMDYGMRATTVGVTVVAFATTAPELFVSTIGALTAADAIALGNIVGSNIANIGLVLGASAVIRPMSIDRRLLFQHGPFMFVAAFTLVVLSQDGMLNTLDGVALLGILVVFTGFLLYHSHRGSGTVLPEEMQPGNEEDVSASKMDVLKTVGAAVCLLIGSRSLILGGRGMLTTLGFGDLFIGLTIIAFGTSVPELATSVVSAIRDEAEFSIGNVIGSNIYNVVAVIGIIALIVPIEVTESTNAYELPAMLGFTVVALGLMFRGERISRPQGAFLMAGYAGFFYFLLP